MAAKNEIGKYAVVPEWVMICTSPSALVLYCYLAINAWGDQGWRIGRRQMMEDLGYGRTKVMELLAELASIKAITIKHNPGPDGGGKGWSTYIVNTVRPTTKSSSKGRNPGPGWAATATQGGPQFRPCNTDTRTQMKEHKSPQPPRGLRRAECPVCGIVGVIGQDVHRVTFHQPRAGKRTHYLHEHCDPDGIVRTGSLRPSFRDQAGDDAYRMK